MSLSSAARPSAPSDPSRQRVELSGGPAAYTDEGAGPAILAVHGLPGSVRDFRWLAPALSPRCRLVRVDLPGFGETPTKTAPDLSPLGRARFIVEFVRAMEVPSPVLLGHSMGGVVSCAAAELAPELFRGLAILASPGVHSHEMLRRVPFGLLGRAMSHRLSRALLLPLVRRGFAATGFRGHSDAVLARTLECVAEVSIAEHRERLRGLSLPTLVAWCDDDPIIQSRLSRELADACPLGPRLNFSKGGHNLQKSHALALGDALSRWSHELPDPRVTGAQGR